MPVHIHFLNVGEGDCTIVEFASGRLAVVDINNGKTLDATTREEVLTQYRATYAQERQSLLAQLVGLSMEQARVAEIEQALTDPIAYLDHWYPGRDIFRLVVTHQDMDHMTGLHRLATQCGRTIYNFWHSGPADFNLAHTSEAEWQACRYDKRDWETYQALRASADSPKAHRKYANEKGQFWTDDGLIVMAPTPALEQQAVAADQPNMISMALAVVYAGVTVVLGGDATADESWPVILQQFQVGKSTF